MPSTTEAVPLSPVIGPCPVRVGMCRDGVAYIETQIQNDVNLNAEEKVILLMSASVARHSYAYWTMVWRDVNDPWWELGDTNKQNPGDVAKADILGAWSGGIRGILRGAMALNPATAASGGVIGAVSGAIVSSAFEYFDLAGYIF